MVMSIMKTTIIRTKTPTTEMLKTTTVMNPPIRMDERTGGRTGGCGHSNDDDGRLLDYLPCGSPPVFNNASQFVLENNRKLPPTGRGKSLNRHPHYFILHIMERDSITLETDCCLMLGGRN